MASWFLSMTLVLSAHHAMCIRTGDGLRRAAPKNFKRKFHIVMESKRSSQYSELKPAQVAPSATQTAICGIEDQKPRNVKKERTEAQNTQLSTASPCKFTEKVAQPRKPPASAPAPKPVISPKQPSKSADVLKKENIPATKRRSDREIQQTQHTQNEGETKQHARDKVPNKRKKPKQSVNKVSKLGVTQRTLDTVQMDTLQTQDDVANACPNAEKILAQENYSETEKVSNTEASVDPTCAG
ncbi:hypothetical protein Y032_0006g3149 [Ancylostoma ceylanicum]|nr:hypothetical protein Y032_0006g3149 [Ancylostoma ceylanicum]